VGSSRNAIAAETLAILQRGGYVAPSGRQVELRAAIDAAAFGTRLYRPDDLDPARVRSSGKPVRPRIEVTGETTAQAARRLVEAEGETHIAALNFASAKNPGGGWLGGAKAQEEDLARASALVPCLETQPVYYETHRAAASLLYTDHMIHAPGVPFFRDDAGALLEAPFLVSILTSAAPNAGEVTRQQPAAAAEIRPTLERRAAKVLALAAERGHRCLVLGAWGCGVFRNEPRDVAEAFAQLLRPPFEGAFERVVFAVYERGDAQPNRRAFAERFGT
jgi:uncharacterized protein (TIGR02452 family)